MQYQDMTIELSEFTRTRTEDRRMVGRCKVRVLESPAGEMKPEEALPVEYDDRELQASLQQLDKRLLDRAGLVALGRTLALLLLPPGKDGAPGDVRGMFATSLAKIGPDVGLRLRLRLPRELAAVPWEYIYVDRAGRRREAMAWTASWPSTRASPSCGMKRSRPRWIRRR